MSIVKVNGNGVKKDPFELLKNQARKGAVKGNRVINLISDCSGSMAESVKDTGERKIDAVRRILSDIKQRYESKVNFQMIGFETKAYLLSDVSHLAAGGMTNIQDGLRLAISPNSHAVLLSDGDETNGRALNEIPRLISDKIVVHCIAVEAGERGERLLQEIAAATGGGFYKIQSRFDEIFEALNKLTSRAVAALTAGARGAIEMGGAE
jgi:hypothetical protein